MNFQSRPPHGGSSQPGGDDQDPQRIPNGWSDTDNDSSIRISSIFHFNTTFDPIKPNTFILTSDRVLFVVHYRWLFAQSANLFGGTLVESAQPTSEHPLVINLPESSDNINILLHAVYSLPCESSMPTFQCLEETFQLLIKYGLLPIQRYISRGTPLYNAFLAQARTMPVEVFTFAASHRLEDLAVQSSAHTLDHPISDFSFEMATQIGTRYMYRLYNLHAMRISRLKELLDMHPQVPLHLDPNLPANECSGLAEDHTQVVTRAYQLAATQVFYSASPAISRTRIESVISGLIGSVACQECRTALSDHVNVICDKWASLPTTI